MLHVAAVGSIGALLGALSGASWVGATPPPSDAAVVAVDAATAVGTAEPATVPDWQATIVFQAVGCPSWSQVPANFTPAYPRDDTEGQYRQWGPVDPATVGPLPADALPGGCQPLDGVRFGVSATPDGEGLRIPPDGKKGPDVPPASDPGVTGVIDGVTGRDGAGTLAADLSQLAEAQRSSLVDGMGLWVAASGFEGRFANLRCHNDRYNADNLEVIRATPQDGLLACVLYVIHVGPLAVPNLPALPPPPVLPAAAAPSLDPTPTGAPTAPGGPGLAAGLGLPATDSAAEPEPESEPPPAESASPGIDRVGALTPTTEAGPAVLNAQPAGRRALADGTADLGERAFPAPAATGPSPAASLPQLAAPLEDRRSDPGNGVDLAGREVAIGVFRTDGPGAGSVVAPSLNAALAAGLSLIFLTGLALTVQVSRRPL